MVLQGIFILLAVLVNFGDSLIVQPSTPLTLTVGGFGLYTCTNPSGSSGSQPAWDNPISDPITAGSSNRVYISESVDPSTLNKVTQLHFRNLRLTDGGNYACKVNGQQTVTRNVIVVEAITFPRMEEEQNQRLLFNTTGTIECTFRPIPQPQLQMDVRVSWQKNSGQVSISNPAKYSSIVAGQLTVYNVIEEDEGTYTCTAYYPDNSISNNLDINVIVQVPPTWRVLPQNRDGVINTDVTLQCLADGNPVPTVTWVDRTRNPFNLTHTPGVYELSDYGSILRIKNLQLPTVGITYNIECTVSNDPVGSKFRTSITRSILLNVLVPPVLTNPVTLEYGETDSRTATFECANTNPGADVTLSFRRDGRDRMDVLVIGAQPDNQQIVVTRNPITQALTLTISNVQREQEGIWTCYGESAAGDVYTDHILNVRYIPLIDQSVTPDRVVSWEGNPTNLTCTFQGYPNPTITWYKNTQRLNATSNVQFLPSSTTGKSVVTITPTLNDFGAYFCNGSNREGFLNYRQELVKASKPSQPVAFEIYDVSSSTMSIRFRPPLDDGGLRVLGYAVSFHVRGTQGVTTKNYENAISDQQLCSEVLPPANTATQRECFNYCDDANQICCPFSTRKLCVNRPTTAEQTDILLTGLSAQSIYVVRVAAKNELGTGDFTENRTVNTEDEKRPDPPNIISRPISDFEDRYDLKWEAPIDDGGIDIERYIIRYSQIEFRDTQSLGPRFVEEKADSTDRHHEIYGLNRGRYYHIELRAENSLGEGEPAEINVETAGTFNFLTTPDTRPKNRGFLGLYNENATIVIVITVLVIFAAFLIITDVCCFCVNDCGLLMFICVTCCGKTPSSTKEEIEMGETEYGGDSMKDWDSIEGKM